MPPEIRGVHHVTAVASSPQRNLDFYARTLGLRLVKRTVNFDDPSTYHFYYGDESGRPGTLLTFFPWPNADRGRVGTGQVTTTAFDVPAGSLDYWRRRLAARDVEIGRPTTRFGERVLAFCDPDGLELELVANPAAASIEPWSAGPVPADHAVRGLHGATLTVEAAERTGELLETMGFASAGEERQRYRYRSSADRGGMIDVRCAPDARPGYVSAGTVHHVAFRVATDAAQRAWRERLLAADVDVTPVIDRRYFRSIYFREPGGVLFEIATEAPGFAIDEDTAALGRSLALPPWLEPERERIVSHLPPLSAPRSGGE